MRKGAVLVGYARVSKADHQDTAAQVKALRKAGCERIFEEKASRVMSIAEGDQLGA